MAPPGRRSEPAGPPDAGYDCSCCGEHHDELPFAYGAAAPDPWSPDLEDDPGSELGGEQCVIKDEAFFLRGLIRLPVLDAPEDFEWGVWASLSEENFERASAEWETEGREHGEPMFGWLCSTLELYDPTTALLKLMVHTQPVGQRPLFVLEPTDHPLAVEQREGITVARVREIAEALLHPSR